MSGSEQTNSPKVSVIIPLYNTEAYVEAAVRSIMEQSLSQIQIIIINDGSSDGSLDVVERLATEDSRIELLSQPNAGPSVARNEGLSRARGRYIYFMDSDDLLEHDALELCYQRCEALHLDFIFFDAESFGAEYSANAWYDYRRAKHYKKEIYTGVEILHKMLENGHYRASSCLNVVSREYINRVGLSYYPGIFHEDELFCAQLYTQAKRVSGIDRSFFRRRLREGSVMTKGFAQRNVDGYLRVIIELKKYAATSDDQSKKLIYKIVAMIVKSLLHNGWLLPFGQRISLIRSLIRLHSNSLPIHLVVKMLFKAPLKKISGR